MPAQSALDHYRAIAGSVRKDLRDCQKPSCIENRKRMIAEMKATGSMPPPVKD